MSQNASLEDLIPVVNKLQDLVFNTVGLDALDLPQVVVVGSQSSGKSSVLENILGRDFLPRGTGIVTRRPLILQLVNTLQNRKSSEKDAGVEWGEFQHLPDRKFYDFDEIRSCIESETQRVAGSNKGINKLPINLKIYSPHVLNLTLVDLPGVTKVPIGDQPSDIEKQTKELVLEYISKPNSLILAVSPANQDIVNSESLKLAKTVDPQGWRTIGVLTKLDLMDKGTNALDVLTGNTYPLRLGFVGVVNRSQQDIKDKKSLRESLRSEQQFFQIHPAYRTIAHRCGTMYLAKTLNQTLMMHIHEKLPDIKSRLNTLIGQTEQELASFGPDETSSQGSRGPLILALMTKFASQFVASIDGTSPNISTKELCGGARIYYIFNKVFVSSLASVDPIASLTHHDVLTAIRNSTGPRAALFVPELAFELLVKPQIRLLEAPSLRCVELVYEELMKICHSCGHTELERFPKLQARLIESLSRLLNERLGPTSRYVSSLIDIQKAYINSNHPNFMTAGEAMANIIKETRFRTSDKKVPTSNSLEGLQLSAVPGSSNTSGGESNQQPSDDDSDSEHTLEGSLSSDQRNTFLRYFFGTTSHEYSENKGDNQLHSLALPKPMFGHQESEDSDMTSREQLECELIMRLITSYFSIVRDTISDQVPKAIMHMLVNHCKEAAQNRLVTDLYRESLFEELLFEDQVIVMEREKCKENLETYRAAAKVINDVI